jgi:endo-1,4-beta-D-glucanase Y
MTKPSLAFPLWSLAAVAMVATVAAMTPIQRDFAAPAPAMAVTKPGSLSPQQWQPWRDRFMTADGRIVDDANKNISHSEGQGYGLLLAVLAQDRAAFARIWGFTRRELLLRDDGLAVWRWDPAANPHVADVNNASDGDILIAYALALAGESWNSPELTTAAQELAKAIGRVLVKRVGDRTLLMPAAKGFAADERQDGPVVNLSYWIFEALPVLARLAPDPDWAALADSGRELVLAARFGPARLPANWISLHSAAPAPARGFDPLFGYDAIRIPLYLVRAGLLDRSLLEPFAKSAGAAADAPAVVNLADGHAANALGDPGYRMIAATVACALDRKPIPVSLRTPAPTNYYPSTLHLLALATISQNYPECL